MLPNQRVYHGLNIWYKRGGGGAGQEVANESMSGIRPMTTTGIEETITGDLLP